MDEEPREKIRTSKLMFLSSEIHNIQVDLKNGYEADRMCMKMLVDECMHFLNMLVQMDYALEDDGAKIESFGDRPDPTPGVSE